MNERWALQHEPEKGGVVVAAAVVVVVVAAVAVRNKEAKCIRAKLIKSSVFWCGYYNLIAERQYSLLITTTMSTPKHNQCKAMQYFDHTARVG